MDFPRQGGRQYGKTAALAAADTRALADGAVVLTVGQPRTCRVCGCTEHDACLDEMGDPCGWAPGMGDLCTACVVPLDRCTGTTPECPHIFCPDGWHQGDDLPCSCTPDCAVDEDE